MKDRAPTYPGAKANGDALAGAVPLSHSLSRGGIRTHGLRIIGPLLYTLLAACGQLPPVVSADTSCERFAHISFSDAQIEAVKADWTLWETAVNQIVSHNVSYDAHCMEVLREGK